MRRAPLRTWKWAPRRVLFGYRHGDFAIKPKTPTLEHKATRSRRSPPLNPRPVATVMDEKWAVKGLSPLVPEPDDPDSVRAATLNRLLHDLGNNDSQMLRRLRSFARAFVRRHMKPVARSMYLEKEDIFQWWLASRQSYTAKMRTQLYDLWVNLRQRTLKAKDKVVKMFVKHESYEKPKHPRAINSRSDAYKCFSGPWFALIEESLYSTCKFFIKHTPVAERADFIARLRVSGSKFAASDYTSFELHMNDKIQTVCEMQAYSYLLSEIPEAQSFLRTHLKVATSKQKITNKYWNLTIPACRMSGETCTSLGNGLTNLILMAFVVHEVGGEVRDAVVEGDDGLYVIGGTCPTPEDFRSRRMDVKLEYHTDLNRAGFCSMFFVDAGDKRVMMRDFREKLVKFGYTLSPLQYGGDEVLRSLLRASALALAYELGQCPIFWVVAREILRETQHVVARFDRSEYHSEAGKNLSVVAEPSLEVRTSYQDVFGVSIEQQLALEAEISVCGLSGPLMQSMCFTPERARMWENSRVITPGMPESMWYDWHTHFPRPSLPGA